MNPRLIEELSGLDARAKKQEREIKEQVLLLRQHCAAERERLSKLMKDAFASSLKAKEMLDEAKRTSEWLATLEPYQR